MKCAERMRRWPSDVVRRIRVPEATRATGRTYNGRPTSSKLGLLASRSLRYLRHQRPAQPRRWQARQSSRRAIRTFAVGCHPPARRVSTHFQATSTSRPHPARHVTATMPQPFGHFPNLQQGAFKPSAAVGPHEVGSAKLSAAVWTPQRGEASKLSAVVGPQWRTPRRRHRDRGASPLRSPRLTPRRPHRSARRADRTVLPRCAAPASPRRGSAPSAPLSTATLASPRCAAFASPRWLLFAQLITHVARGRLLLQARHSGARRRAARHRHPHPSDRRFSAAAATLSSPCGAALASPRSAPRAHVAQHRRGDSRHCARSPPQGR